MAILSFLPDWVLFGIIISIFVAVYLFLLTDQMRKGVLNFLKGYGIYIVGALAIIYYWDKWGLISDHPDQFPATCRTIVFWVLFVIIVYNAFKLWLYENRFYTNHLIADNLHSSCHRYQEISCVGDKTSWIVFFLGGSGTSDERFVMPWPWVHKILVVPKCACQFIGNQILVKSQVEKIDLYDLPEDIKDFIEKDNFGQWCKEEIYFGLWDIDLKIRNPDVEEIKGLNKKLNERINELNDMLKGKLTRTKGFVSDTMAMTDKLKGKDFRSGYNPQQPREE